MYNYKIYLLFFNNCVQPDLWGGHCVSLNSGEIRACHHVIADRVRTFYNYVLMLREESRAGLSYLSLVKLKSFSKIYSGEQWSKYDS